MRYSQLICYRRFTDPTGQDRLAAIRVSEGHGHVEAVEVPMSALFGGHCEWIRRDIDARNAKRRFGAAAVNSNSPAAAQAAA